MAKEPTIREFAEEAATQLVVKCCYDILLKSSNISLPIECDTSNRSRLKFIAHLKEPFVEYKFFLPLGFTEDCKSLIINDLCLVHLDYDLEMNLEKELYNVFQNLNLYYSSSPITVGELFMTNVFRI